MSGSDNKTSSTPANELVLASKRFDRAVKYVMLNEDGVDWDHDKGTYTNNPADPGGRTLWGIIQSEYEDFLGQRLTEVQLKAIPRATAVQIYRRKFWDIIHGDSYSSEAVATALFDTAVNKGLGGCHAIVQDALGIKVSRYGQDFLQAIAAVSAVTFMTAFEAAVERYIDARITKFPNMEWARAGWTNRAKRLKTLLS